MKQIITLFSFLFAIAPISRGQCAFTTSINSNNPSCHNFSDGSINVNVSGGTGAITYLITDSLGNQVNFGGGISNNLTAGWYYITVSDESPCSEMDSVYLVNPGELDIFLSITHPFCFSDSTGTVTVDTVINAQGNYNQISYFWSPAGTGGNGIGANSQSNLPGGNYVLTINDEIGCSRAFDIEIIAPPELYFSEIGFDPCTDTTTGVVYMSAAGGTPGYTYEWLNLCDSTSSSNTTWGGLNPCCYEAVVTDANGCMIQHEICLSCLGLSEVQFNVDLYPNPSRGKFTIVSDHNGIAQIMICNSSGALVYQDQMTQSKIEIDLGELNGFFWILLQAETGIVRKKVIVE